MKTIRNEGTKLKGKKSQKKFAYFDDDDDDEGSMAELPNKKKKKIALRKINSKIMNNDMSHKRDLKLSKLTLLSKCEKKYRLYKRHF